MDNTKEYPYDTPGLLEASDKQSSCNGQKGLGIYHCDVCENLYSVVTYRDHEYDPKNITVQQASTCVSEGVGKVTCTKCRKTVEVALEKKPHAYVGELQETANGFAMKLTCSNSACGHTTIVSNSQLTVTESTCCTHGLISYQYEGMTISCELPYSEHTLNGELMDKEKYPNTKPGLTEVADQKATADKDGLGVFICDDCDGLIAVTTYLPQNG